MPDITRLRLEQDRLPTPNVVDVKPHLERRLLELLAGDELSAGRLTITGRTYANWDSAEVWLNEEGAARIHLPHLEYHSPTGFAWGYGGSGPADLALSILYCVIWRAMLGELVLRYAFVGGPEVAASMRSQQAMAQAIAWRYHHDYKADVVSVLPTHAMWRIDEADVLTFLVGRIG